MTIITDIKLLKRMAKRGYIELHPHTGKKVKHWSGQYTISYYVEGKGEKLERERDSFIFEEKEYELTYLDGCFFPFVTEVGKPKPPFV